MRRTVGQYLLDKFQDKISAVQNRHSTFSIKLRWTPGHNSIPGNEQADMEAKQQQAGTRALHVFCPSHARAQCHIAGPQSDRTTKSEVIREPSCSQLP